MVQKLPTGLGYAAYGSEQELFERIASEFRMRGQKYPWMIYDADDILWSLMTVVSQRLGIEFERCTRIFSITDNYLLTPEEREQILTAFEDVSFFQNMQFYPGVKEIMRPTELGAKVGINSNALTQDIGDTKTDQLLATIPGLRVEDIQMNIIDRSKNKKKPLSPDITSLSEDSPYNVALSEALINVMPRTIPWAYYPSSIQIMQNKPVIWKNNLQEMVDFNYRLVEYLAKVV